MTVRPNGDRLEKSYRLGTHRIVDPAETLAWVMPMARQMGITRIANVTGLDVVGIPVVAVMRPNSKSLAVAQGKGVDLPAAKASGLMESIENFHAENICLPLVLETEERLRARGAGVVDVEGLPRQTGSSYAPDQRLLWVEGRDVINRRSVWLPYEVVHADYSLPLVAGSGAFLMTDNGLASGNHPFEATSHAICELVERDAVTLWQHAGGADQTASRVNLDTVADPACRRTIERFAAAALRVAVWEITSDVGIPAFMCEIADADPTGWRSLGATSGSGCHPCREVALLRALTEAAQARLTVIAGSRDDLGVEAYLRGADRESMARTLAMMDRPASRPFSAAPTHDGGTIADDLGWEVERLAGAGFRQVVVVDLTLPEFGIPVVRAVIPGLEGICDAPGFVPGRRVRAAAA